ncbi:MAG: hypothetical protein ACREJG_14130, partial [Candidatus Rokuibacteriota bacterium]
MGNPWKLTAIGMALVMATALVTGLVVANWTGPESSRIAVDTRVPQSSRASGVRPVSRTVPARVTMAPAVATPPAVSAQPAVPPQAVIEACNRQAAARTGPHDKTVEIV